MADAAQFTFAASDGYAFPVRRYSPPEALGSTKGRIVFVHGTRSHGGWYVRSCTELAAAGYEVHFLDRRGAGRSEIARGDTPGFRRLLADVNEYLDPLRADKLPLFLAGISWGGKTAAAVAAIRPDLVDGLVLFCPGFVPKVGVPFADKVRIAFARFLNPTRPFAVPLNDPELFTASAEWQRFLRDDTLGLTTATARFLFESVRLDLFLKRNVSRVTAPILLLLAGRDRVIDNAATREYLKRFRSAAAVSEIEYPDAHHTLEFEPPGHPFVQDVLAWLSKRGA